VSILVVSSSEPGVGKSVIAAAIAYRMAADGSPVMLARLDGDAGAAADAMTFATLDEITSPGKPIAWSDLSGAPSTTEVVVEAPAGSTPGGESISNAKILNVAVRTPDAVAGSSIGTIVTRVAPRNTASAAAAAGVIAVMPEDRILAAPSVDDISRAIEAQWLVEASERGSIDRVMIGTVASDAASPYFGARDRKAVITRYDKTDIQLAALLTDVDLLVLTGGGQPSPYLLDRVKGTREDISVVLATDDTVDTMRAIEGLYGSSRFDGRGKMLRAAEMLDESGCPVRFG
jgi:hypothetical protein